LSRDDLFTALPPPGSAGFASLIGFCQECRPRVLAALPWVAAEVAGNDGFAIMLAFVSRWSGSRFYVPPDHGRFTQKAGFAIGHATHRRFLKEAGPAALVEIPSAWGVFLSLRRVAAAAALARGDPPARVARRFGVTERSLRASARPM
jgi:hypothetical protein